MRIDAEREELRKLTEANKNQKRSLEPTLPDEGLADISREVTVTRLMYWDLNLHADAIRLAMHFAQMNFEDCRIKPSSDSQLAELWRPFFTAALVEPDGPLLEIDGLRLGGAMPILNFICRKYKFESIKPAERYRADWFCIQTQQLVSFFAQPKWHETTADERTKMLSEFKEKIAPPILQLINSVYVANAAEGGTFLVNPNQVTSADFAVCCALDNIFLNTNSLTFIVKGKLVPTDEPSLASRGLSECLSTHAPKLYEWVKATTTGEFAGYFNSEQRRPRRGF